MSEPLNEFTYDVFEAFMGGFEKELDEETRDDLYGTLRDTLPDWLVSEDGFNDFACGAMDIAFKHRTLEEIAAAWVENRGDEYDRARLRELVGAVRMSYRTMYRSELHERLHMVPCELVELWLKDESFFFNQVHGFDPDDRWTWPDDPARCDELLDIMGELICRFYGDEVSES